MALGEEGAIKQAAKGNNFLKHTNKKRCNRTCTHTRTRTNNTDDIIGIPFTPNRTHTPPDFTGFPRDFITITPINITIPIINIAGRINIGNSFGGVIRHFPINITIPPININIPINPIGPNPIIGPPNIPINITIPPINIPTSSDLK